MGPKGALIVIKIFTRLVNFVQTLELGELALN